MGAGLVGSEQPGDEFEEEREYRRCSDQDENPDPDWFAFHYEALPFMIVRSIVLALLTSAEIRRKYPGGQPGRRWGA